MNLPPKNYESLDNFMKDFDQRLRCFKLKRDIDRLLNLEWMKERYAHKEDKPLASNTKVYSMAEFYERLQEDIAKNRNLGDELKSQGLRTYELEVKDKAAYFL